MKVAGTVTELEKSLAVEYSNSALESALPEAFTAAFRVAEVPAKELTACIWTVGPEL